MKDYTRLYFPGKNPGTKNSGDILNISTLKRIVTLLGKNLALPTDWLIAVGEIPSRRARVDMLTPS